MTNRHIQQFCNRISSLSGAELLSLREILNEKIDEVSGQENNFMLHDYLDEYFYIVHYEDGRTYLYTKGVDAYNEYINSAEAVSIVRKTKNLFPTFEEIMSKEKKNERKEKRLRH